MYHDDDESYWYPVGSTTGLPWYVEWAAASVFILMMSMLMIPVIAYVWSFLRYVVPGEAP